MAQLTAGSKAPAFSLAGSDGGTHSLAALRGKPVVLRSMVALLVIAYA